MLETNDREDASNTSAVADMTPKGCGEDKIYYSNNIFYCNGLMEKKQ